MKPLGVRLAIAIRDSDLLEDKKKLMALTDLEKMYTDKDYFKSCMEGEFPSERAVSLWSHHIWDQSKLGFDFWDRMHYIIGAV